MGRLLSFLELNVGYVLQLFFSDVEYFYNMSVDHLLLPCLIIVVLRCVLIGQTACTRTTVTRPRAGACARARVCVCVCVCERERERESRERERERERELENFILQGL